VARESPIPHRCHRRSSDVREFVLQKQPCPVDVADAADIRAVRARNNQAIADHDTIALAEAWAPEFWLVSSTNAQTAGRDAARGRFAQQFATRRDLLYVRTPDSVVVNSAWGQAAEYGTWTGRWSQNDGVTNVGGRYFAKWRKAEGRWMLLAETYVQTSCRGTSYCTQRP
jgi:ketosteroid isomerase-like protein